MHNLSVSDCTIKAYSTDVTSTKKNVFSHRSGACDNPMYNYILYYKLPCVHYLPLLVFDPFALFKGKINGFRVVLFSGGLVLNFPRCLGVETSL